MRKLLASDVDGTLFVNQDIHEKSIEYIKEFRSKGHAFLLCTGRNLGGVKHIFTDYDIEVDGLVLCNGSLVLDKDLNIIHDNKINDEIIKLVFNDIKDSNEYNFYFSDNERLYIVDGYNDHPMISSADMADKMEVVRIKEEDFYKNTYTANIIGIDNKEECIIKTELKKKEIEEKFSGQISIFRNQSFIDIAPNNTSKAQGIHKVLEDYGVKEDNVFVIGDSWNDLSMFEKYKNSYTFSYAEEELKPHASNIVDAFYDCLDMIIK
ncbi:MAG: Cof-type HAD-IIB family hydrolase [Paraclostridium sp.]